MIDAGDPDAKVTLQGHSLGGHTAAYAMANSDQVLKRVSSLDTFNTAAHPSFSVGLHVPFHKHQVLHEKTTHHRLNADVVSKGHLVNLPFGKSITYKHRTDKTFIGRALDAHHIDHFFNKELVEKGGSTTPTISPPTSMEGRVKQVVPVRASMTLGQGAKDVNPYAVCKRNLTLPECKAFL